MSLSYAPEAESFTSPELALGFDEATELMAAIGNHELKAYTLLLLARNGGYLARSPMGKLLTTAAQESGALWVPNPNAAFGYCENSLDDIGQVVKGQVPSTRGLSDAYRISERGIMIGVALAGLILDWSLRFPDISVQKILSSTNSKGDTRSPQHHIKVLYELLTNPKAAAGVSLIDIAGSESQDWQTALYHTTLTNIDHAVRNLEARGFVRVDRVQDQNDRSYRILDPVKPTTTTNTSVVADGIYACMQAFADDGTEVVTYDQIQKFVTTFVMSQEPRYDPQLIRKQLSSLLSAAPRPYYRLADGTLRSYQTIPGLERLGVFNEGDLTRVFLEPGYEAAFEELIEIVYAVETGDLELLGYGYERAREILSSNETTKQIFDKAYQFSAGANRLTMEEHQKNMLALLEGTTNGPLDTETLRAEYNLRHDRLLSRASIQNVMRSLVELGKVVVTQARPNPSIAKQRNFYTLADQQAEHH